jgi:hypothetical protein
MAPILGIYASQISGHLFSPSGAWDSIATTTVGAGGQASVTFSSIPSTYTHLQIRALGRSSFANTFSSIEIQFNADTGANYAWHYLKGSGSAASSSASTSDTVMRAIDFVSASQASGIFSAYTMDILDYTNTSKNTTMRIFGGADCNGSGGMDLHSGAWFNTSAVTSIKLAASNASNFEQYSSFALYGIKGGN